MDLLTSYRLMDSQQSLKCSWSIVAPFLSVLFVACSSTLVAPVPGFGTTNQGQAERLRQAAALQEQAQALFDQGQYVNALSPAKAAVTMRESLLGTTDLDVATSLTTLGLIHGVLIELTQATPLLARALEIRRSRLGPSHPSVGESLTNLGSLQYAGGNFSAAVDTLQQALKIREQSLGPTDPEVAITLSHLAIALRGLSRLEQARTTADRAVTILRTAQPARPNDLAMAVNVNGNILGRLGNFEGARSLLEESLHLFEQASGSHHPYVASALVQLGMLEGKQGNFVAALPLLKRALVINEQSYGTENPEVAGNLYEIGLAERALGVLAGAQKRFEQALKIQEAKIDPKHPFVALTLIELAEGKNQHGDRGEARRLLVRALHIQEQSLGHDHTSVAHTLMNLGHLDALSQDLPSAESSFERALQIRERSLGSSHRDVAASLLELARAKHARGQLAAARPLYAQASRILQSQQGINPGLPDEALGMIWKKDLKGLQDYALLLATMVGNLNSNTEQRSAIADGFMISQQARGWLMQAAVARVLAQQAIGDASVAALAKRVDELRRKRQVLWTRLNELYGLADAQRSAEELSAAKRTLSMVQQELDQAGAALRSTAPRYAEMAQPEALDVDGVQRLLLPGEALVSFYTLGDRVQIWLIRPRQNVLYRHSTVTREQLSQLVRQIRVGLRPIGSVDGQPVFAVPFDVESASQLFQFLFAPLAAQLQGIEHLIVVPDDVLLPLPFAALITEPQGEVFSRLAQRSRDKQTSASEDFASYATLPWLAMKYPLTILPSASALKLVRQQPPQLQGRGELFLGFGDPALRGRGHQRGGAMISSRGMRVTMESLHALDQLPGTREELLTVAAILGVNAETNLFLGPRAVESEVRRLNASGRLGQTQVIAFATHGLLAGEVRGVTQPALVLTPPVVPTEEDDGLLSLEDVLQLKLPQTDWVILSACNTAGDNGSGESLTGLARAFFFAGARSLLVSQWSVDDRATKVLMEQVFQRYGKHPSLPPAKALQAGMLALLNHPTKAPDQLYFAHPYAWAPFMVVGDGQSSQR